MHILQRTTAAILPAMVTVVAVVAASVVVAGPAYAESDPVRVALTGVSNTAPAKTMRAECPNNTVVFGVGGLVNPGGGNVILTGIVPDASLAGVTVSGLANAAQTAPWSLTAVVVCHNPGSRSPVRTLGLGLIWNASTDCYGGRILYGVGFEILNPTATAFVDQVVPRTDLSGADVHARGTDIGLFHLVAYGVCALPLSRGERTQDVSADDATSPKSGTAPKATVVIHDDGSWVFAAGALITGTGNLHIDALTPTDGLDGGYARASRIPLNFPHKSTAKRVAVMAGTDDYSLTTYGDTIGSWY
jgi:hypothetical protein